MRIDEIFRRIVFRLRGRVLHFAAPNKKGEALMSYITLPFLNTSERTLNAHTNRWESMEMVRALVERGYAVDLIDIHDSAFIPKKKYDIFIDNHYQMERLLPHLPPSCVKVFHITTSDWKFQNEAEQRRFDALYERRGVRLRPDRPLQPNRALELCDIASMLGNDVTASTYAYGNKEIIQIPLSTTHTYPSPEQKNFERVKNNFVWFGGAGAIHKGLDLVVEAFAKMPEFNLTICGKLDGETDFKEIYKKELTLPNIHLAGFMDPGSPEFKNLADNSIALIYPSCAEGQAGSVILCMHAGLIPIISRESGVETQDFGVILKENTIEQIMQEVRILALLPAETLRTRATATWHYANTHHTREAFAKAYRAFIDVLIERFRL
jgi:glycosyltransferase involved in cell wall biosynthesis